MYEDNRSHRRSIVGAREGTCRTHRQTTAGTFRRRPAARARSSREKKRKHHTTPSKLVVCNEKSQVYSDPVFLSFGLAENLCQPSPLRPPSVQITCSRKLLHLTSRGMKMRLWSMINVDTVKIKVGIKSMSILMYYTVL